MWAQYKNGNFINVSVIANTRPFPCRNARRWMPRDIINDKLNLVQVTQSYQEPQRYPMIEKYFKITITNRLPVVDSWWRNQMEKFSALIAGKFTGDRWFPPTKASDAELWCFLLSAPCINGWVNNGDACDLRRRRAHYDVTVMLYPCSMPKMIYHPGDIEE